MIAPTTRIAEIGHPRRPHGPAAGKLPPRRTGRRAARPPPPAFLFGGADAATARAIYGQIETPQTGCYAIADAAVAPTGIALRDGVAFCGAQLNLPPEHVATITARLSGADLPLRFVEGPLVALFGPAEEAYGQLLIDYLPRLWLLEQAGYSLARLRFLVPAILPERATELLAHLGLSADQVVPYAHWDELIHTDLLVLPTTLRRHERLSPGFGAATRLWTGRVRDRLDAGPPDLPRRVFTAPQGGGRFEALAAGAGYTVLRPGAMDLAARAASFGAATRIAGPAGEHLHDSVFCAPGAKICALRAGPQGGFLQTGLGAALGLETGYVFSDDDAELTRALDVLGL